MDMWSSIGATMSADVQRLSSIANNIANSATPAFKRELLIARPFASYLPQTATTAGPAWQAVTPALEVRIDHRPGTLKFTGNPLDLALEDGNTFFELGGGSVPVYTRQGNFRLDVRGRLVTESGVPVMGVSGEIFLNSPNPAIDAAGRIVDGSASGAQIRIVRIPNVERLEKLGSGLFQAGGATIAPQDRFERVRQGYLEVSNVNVMTEMVGMIETLRRFELGQRVLQGYDGALERAIRTLGEF